MAGVCFGVAQNDFCQHLKTWIIFSKKTDSRPFSGSFFIRWINWKHWPKKGWLGSFAKLLEKTPSVRWVVWILSSFFSSPLKSNFVTFIWTWSLCSCIKRLSFTSQELWLEQSSSQSNLPWKSTKPHHSTMHSHNMIADKIHLECEPYVLECPHLWRGYIPHYKVPLLMPFKSNFKGSEIRPLWHQAGRILAAQD